MADQPEIVDWKAHEEIGKLMERVDRLEKLALLDHHHNHVLPAMASQLQNETAQIVLQMTEEHSHDVKLKLPE